MYTKNRKRKLSVRAPLLVIGYLGIISLLTSFAQAQSLPRYRVTDLGLLYQQIGNESEAYDISNQNHVVGWSHQFVDLPISGVTRRCAFLWMPDGSVPLGFPFDLTAGLNDLKVFAGADLSDAASEAHAIIRSGTDVRITGQSSTDVAGVPHGFLWEPIVFNVDPNERLIDIGDLGDGSQKSNAWGITGSDPDYFVVGSSETEDFACMNEIISRGFLWDSSNATMTPLATPTDNHSVAYDIFEDSGNTLIGGGDTKCGNNPCPLDAGDSVAWTNLALGPLAQPLGFGNIAGEARDLNDAGNLVGWGMEPTDPCTNRALFWENTVSVAFNLHTDISNPLPPTEETRALGMNSNKDVVGVNDVTEAAVIWESTGPGTWSYSDLNDLISSSCDWELRKARAINDNGWIVGWGIHDTNHRAFLMRPIETCLHDLDDDGEVSTLDLLTLLASWGDCPDVATTGQFCDADYDCDGSVGTTDLLALLANWGPCFIGAEIPQNIQDCLDKYCCSPEDLLALEKCLCIIDPACDPSP